MNREDYNQLSADLRKLIPPFPKGKTVSFRSLEAPGPAREVINKAGDTELRPQQAQPMSLKASAIIFDPFSGKDVQLAALGAVGLQNAGTPMAGYAPAIQYLEFDETGVCTLGEKDKLLYEVAMLLPSNKNNVLPGAEPPATGYKFELVDFEKAAEDDVDLLEKSLAVKAQVKEMTPSELRATAQRLGGIDTTGTDAQLKKALYALCDADPNRVLQCMNDYVTQNTALINDAKEAGAIRFYDEAQAWKYVATAQVIMATAGHDPLLTLVDFLSTPEGQKARTAIQTATEAAKKAAKGNRR